MLTCIILIATLKHGMLGQMGLGLECAFYPAIFPFLALVLCVFSPLSRCFEEGQKGKKCSRKIKKMYKIKNWHFPFTQWVPLEGGILPQSFLEEKFKIMLRGKLFLKHLNYLLTVMQFETLKNTTSYYCPWNADLTFPEVFFFNYSRMLHSKSASQSWQKMQFWQSFWCETKRLYLQLQSLK